MVVILRDAASREVFAKRDCRGWFDTVPVPHSGDYVTLNGGEYRVDRVTIEYHEVPNVTVTVDLV